MNFTPQQVSYWNRAAAEKVFSHPLQFDPFSRWVARDSRILDYGCGYGRICAELRQRHYPDLVGVDLSAAMIRKGRSLHPDLDLRHISSANLPFADHSFDACLLFAVLNCIPADAEQTALLAELHRLLRPGGILYLSDYPLQNDERNLERYAGQQKKYGRYGIFEVDGGRAVMRHHDRPWLDQLLHAFEPLWETQIDISTMNGNPARALQIMARKQPSAE